MDVHKKKIYPASVYFENEFITNIERCDGKVENYILPGLIDSHVHIESSMITPGAFAQAAVKHGTTGVVSDPHEIANVMGLEGIEFMISDAKKVPVNFWFGASSCVPATDFETSGASINSNGIEKLLLRDDIKYLSEMMNFPGVIYGNKEVLEKINIARRLSKPVDGHAPGLTGEMLKKYVNSGISTDHECTSLKEAEEKIFLGMKILIREGSAAKNLDDLKELFKLNPEMIMLCSDDLHPEMLVKGHINKLIAKLVSEDYDIFNVIQSCTVNPVRHYGLDAGLLKQGQPADMIIVDDCRKMNVLETWIRGRKVFDRGSVLFKYNKGPSINKFNSSEIKPSDIEVRGKGSKMRVIEASDGSLFTKCIIRSTGSERIVESNTREDILKIIVKDRYTDKPASVGFIKGFGLKEGAIASSVAHDSHNIISVGANDEDIVMAVNEIIRLKGGLSVAGKGRVTSLKLSIAGIMSDDSCEEVAADYQLLSGEIRSLGCTLNAPFMTLSFMALLVIPELKIGDRGLFDVEQFKLTSLFSD